MNRIKLPQDGQIIDTDSIIGAYWQDDPATRLIVRLEGMKDGLLFTGTDARALYAWLEAHSTAIGEDGRKVVMNKEPRIKDFLAALARGDINAQFTQRAEDTFNIDTATLMSMAKDGAIRSGREGWEITQRGRDYLELLTMEID